MNKKTFKILMWTLAIASFVILVVAGIVAFSLKNAWWFGVPAIVIGSAWLIFFIIWIIRKLSTASDQKGKIDVGDAIRKEVEAMKHDENNADNFKVTDTMIQRRGKSNPKTDVLVIFGWGTEKTQRRVSVVNLDEKDAVSRLIDPQVDQVAEAIRLIAKEPEDPVITKKTVESLDKFGVLKREIAEPVQTPKKEEEVKKDAEAKNGT